MTHPHVDLLRSGYGLRDDQEVEAVGAWFHNDITWHLPGKDLHGRDEVLSMLAQADDVAGGTTRREVHAILADDEYGVVLTTVRADRSGDSFEDRGVHVYRFEDGKVIEFWGYSRDPRAHDEFWSQQSS